MKVKELIERLSKCDPEKDVYIAQDDHYYTHLKAYSVNETDMDVEEEDSIIHLKEVVQINYS